MNLVLILLNTTKVRGDLIEGMDYKVYVTTSKTLAHVHEPVCGIVGSRWQTRGGE